jgi:hypothetical protein
MPLVLNRSENLDPARATFRMLSISVRVSGRSHVCFWGNIAAGQMSGMGAVVLRDGRMETGGFRAESARSCPPLHFSLAGGSLP